jgi:glycosyltransferase involved in cell wall biosynthesis
MSFSPKVSILMPCYNSADFIDDAIQSCIQQTYENIEIIVVDDGSSDQSVAIARKWEAQHKNIRVYQQENSGACRARNIAFEKSTGDYIMYLDADDIMSPNKINEQIAILAGKTSDSVATCKWDRFYNDISDGTFPVYKCYKNYVLGIDLLVDLWSSGEMFAASCYLVSRQLVQQAGPWNEELKKNQDGDFFVRVLMHARSVYFCDKAKVYYRTGSYSSVSKDNSKAKLISLLESFIGYKKILKYEDSQRTRMALARNFSLFCYLYNSKYPDLCKRARHEVKALGVKMPIVGTKLFVAMASLLGLPTAFWIRKHLLKR